MNEDILRTELAILKATLQYRLRNKTWRTVAGVEIVRRAVQLANESAAAYKASREDDTRS